jgi:hypothetical protein
MRKIIFAHCGSDSASLRPVSLVSAPAASAASESAGVRYVTVTSEPRYIPVTIATGKLVYVQYVLDGSGL